MRVEEREGRKERRGREGRRGVKKGKGGSKGPTGKEGRTKGGREKVCFAVGDHAVSVHVTVIHSW